MKKFFILSALMLLAASAYAQSNVSDNAGDNVKEIVARLRSMSPLYEDFARKAAKKAEK